MGSCTYDGGLPTPMEFNKEIIMGADPINGPVDAGRWVFPLNDPDGGPRVVGDSSAEGPGQCKSLPDGIGPVMSGHMAAAAPPSYFYLRVTFDEPFDGLFNIAAPGVKCIAYTRPESAGTLEPYEYILNQLRWSTPISDWTPMGDGARGVGLAIDPKNGTINVTIPGVFVIAENTGFRLVDENNITVAVQNPLASVAYDIDDARWSIWGVESDPVASYGGIHQPCVVYAPAGTKWKLFCEGYVSPLTYTIHIQRIASLD